MKYTVVIERTPNNYAAYVPTLTRRCAPPSPNGRGSGCGAGEPQRYAATSCAQRRERVGRQGVD